MQADQPNPKQSTEPESKRISEIIQNLKKDLLTYLEKRIELIVIQITDPAAQFISGLLQQFFGVLIFFAGFIFLWVALALYLAEVLNSTVGGFLASGIPLLLIGAVFIFRKPGILYSSIHSRLTSQLMEAFHRNQTSSSYESRNHEADSKSRGENG